MEPTPSPSKALSASQNFLHFSSSTFSTSSVSYRMNSLHLSESAFTPFHTDSSPSPQHSIDDILTMIGWFRWRRLTLYFITASTLFLQAACASSFSVIGERVDALNPAMSCDLKRFLAPTYFGGYVLSSLISGYIDDRVGRRPPILFFQVLTTCGLVLSLSIGHPTNHTCWVLYAGSFMTGLGATLCELTQVLKTEFASGEERDVDVALWLSAWPLGIMFSTALTTYAFPKDEQWRGYLGVLAGIGLILFISQWFLIDESPRYFLAKGKVAKAEEILESLSERWPSCSKLSICYSTCCKNSETSSESNTRQRLWLLQPLTQTISPLPLLHLFTKFSTASRLITVSLCCFATSGAYYSSLLSQPTNHAQLFFLSLTELPANLFLLILGRFIGRVWTLLLVFTALTLLFSLTAGFHWTFAWLLYVGRFLVGGGFNMIWLANPDMFAVASRAQASTLAAAISHVAAMIIPLISSYISVTLYNSLIAGLMGFSTVLIGFFIPDMIGKNLRMNE